MKRTPLATIRAARIALAAVVLAVAVGALVDVRAGALLLVAAALAAVAARLLLPAERSFAVRRRTVDVAMLSTFAVVLAFLALTTPLG